MCAPGLRTSTNGIHILFSDGGPRVRAQGISEKHELWPLVATTYIFFVDALRSDGARHQKQTCGYKVVLALAPVHTNTPLHN
jgi:hypothetical protein